MATINTQSAQCIENMLKMTTPEASAHGKEQEKENKIENKGNKKREKEPERHTGELVLLKVQVQDLSDCQAALSFWFHINVVSFLPRLSSPALLHSSPCSAVHSFPSAPLTPKLYRKHR